MPSLKRDLKKVLLVGVCLVTIAGSFGVKQPSTFAAEILRKVSRAFSDTSIKLTYRDLEALFVVENVDGVDAMETLSEISKSSDQSIICSFSFAKLGKPSQTVLLVSADPGGRRFCADVYIFWQRNGQLWRSNVSAWGVTDVSTLVRPLDGSDHPVLIVPYNFSGQHAATDCQATVPEVYDLIYDNVTNVSFQYPGFYKAQILSLPSLQGLMGGENCTTMERDKLRRLEGSEPKAGLDHALVWMTSRDAEWRQNAATVFGDIGGSFADMELRRMLTDSDPTVALLAHEQLKGNIRSSH